MNKNISVGVLLVLLISCSTLKKIDSGLSPIVQRAKETSLYSHQIEWDKINRKYLSLTEGKNSIEERKSGYQFLINSLRDKHACIRDASDYSIIVSYTGAVENPDKRDFDSDFINNTINNVDSKFSYVTKAGVGILRIVGIGLGDVKKHSDEIRNGLVKLKEQGINRWIVDLRYNGGGNIEPMISGLAPLIGEGKIGGSVNLENEPLIEFTIEDSKFYNYGRLVCDMGNKPEISQDEKVVVLLSRYTVSSGEMLGIAFKGRPNTFFIGERSGGLTTGNGFDLIEEDKVYLVISQGIFIDRNGTTYKEGVNVDEEIEFDITATLENDKQIMRAIEWLKE